MPSIAWLKYDKRAHPAPHPSYHGTTSHGSFKRHASRTWPIVPRL